MLYFTDEKKDCVGCGACVVSCPVNCISMVKDVEGFLYPVVTDQCIYCGKCKAVCPISKMPKKFGSPKIEQKAYCAVSKNKRIWKRSASGGAFSEICRAFGDINTIVCGAAWDKFRVHHVCVKGVDNITPLCKSKYVASDTENAFSDIKKYVNSGAKVVFCGTPCQVAGLRKVVGKDTENLLLIDLICHGVGSPDVFCSCIHQIESQFGNKVLSYQFRAKRKAFEGDHVQKIEMEGGHQLYLVNDPYIQLFLKQTCLRPSCGQNCQFRCEQRQGDITIADFKGLTKVFPKLAGAKKNYSSIIFNTQKGYNIFPLLKSKMKMYPCDINDIKRYNPLFYKHTWFSESRDSFFSEYKDDPQGTIIRYTEPVRLLQTSWKRNLWMLFPQFVRKMVIKIRG